MNEKEKTEFYIAMCACCMLAQTMKECPLCHFNIGLAEKAMPVDVMPIPVQIPVFAMAE